jgi:hypothetical protein
MNPRTWHPLEQIPLFGELRSSIMWLGRDNFKKAILNAFLSSINFIVIVRFVFAKKLPKIGDLLAPYGGY